MMIIKIITMHNNVMIDILLFCFYIFREKSVHK